MDINFILNEILLTKIQVLLSIDSLYSEKNKNEIKIH